MKAIYYCPRCRYLLIRGSDEDWQSCLMCGGVAPWWAYRSHFEDEPATRYPDRDRLRRRVRLVRFIAAVRGVPAELPR
jgi:hypothetical protein